jgi:hypothetical protein
MAHAACALSENIALLVQFGKSFEAPTVSQTPTRPIRIKREEIEP